MSEDTNEEESTNDEYDQDSSISFEDDTESTSSQEEELENWIEYMKRSCGLPPKIQTYGPEEPPSETQD